MECAVTVPTSRADIVRSGGVGVGVGVGDSDGVGGAVGVGDALGSGTPSPAASEPMMATAAVTRDLR